ncbi:MAG: hypothetical protein KGI92_13600, partial [Alphaproteobacteria bacterium]|nr:hypothetical protein [Alphaproteobacteria bacterium]
SGDGRVALQYMTYCGAQCNLKNPLRTPMPCFSCVISPQDGRIAAPTMVTIFAMHKCRDNGSGKLAA